MINVMCLNHPQTIPLLPIHGLKKTKKCLSQNRSLGPKRLGTTGLEESL